MNEEQSILALADNYRVFESGTARLVYIHNSRQQPFEHMFGFWSFDPCSDDNEAVFDMLHAYLRTMGITTIIGPINYCTWFEHRLALDNFDTFFYPDRQGSKSQNEFLMQQGYEVLHVSAATLIEINKKLLNKNIRMAQGFCCKEFHGESVRPILPTIHALSCEIFGDFALYSPLSYDDYVQLYLANLNQITPDVALFFDHDMPIGFAFGYQNPDKKCYIGKTMGVLKQYRSTRMVFAVVEKYISFLRKYDTDRFVFHYRPIEKPIADTVTFGEQILKKHYGLYIKRLGE